LAASLNMVNLNAEKDQPCWEWSPKKIFTVKSVYDHLTKGDSEPFYKRIWKAKLPEKIKIFMCMLEQKTILTKENMLKRKWQRDPSCYMYGDPEDSGHLMFSCPVSKVIWGVIVMCFHQSTRPMNYEQY
jgi:hypothetical protein